MADIAPQHLFLAESLRAVLLSPVAIVMMDNGSAGVMAPFGGSNGRAFQVAAQIVDVLPGIFGLLGKMDFPAPLELHLKKLTPFAVVTDVLITGGR